MNETLHKPNINELEKNLSKLTNEEWQIQFELLKQYIKPVNDTTLSRKARNTYIVGRRWTLTDNEYGGDTQDSYYCIFINDILKQIRSKRGKCDFAYHTYNICDLLKFENNLRTELIHDGDTDYFKVWLDK